MLASVTGRTGRLLLGVNVYPTSVVETLTPGVKASFFSCSFSDNLHLTLASLFVLVIHCQCAEQRSCNRGAAWTETCTEKSAAVCFVLHFMLTHFFSDNHTRSDLNVSLIDGDLAHFGKCY